MTPCAAVAGELKSVAYAEVFRRHSATTPSPEVDPDRLDRIGLLLERKAQALAQSQQAFELDLAQVVAQMFAADENTQHSLQFLAETAERFIAAADQRLTRAETAIDALARSMVLVQERTNGKKTYH
jgi:hypothetical protein